MTQQQRTDAAAVKTQLQEAGRTLRGLPPATLAARRDRLQALWPDVPLNHWTALHRSRRKPPLPTPEAVARLDECLDWLTASEPDQRRLLGAWMLGMPRATLGVWEGVGRTAIHNRVTAICAEIAHGQAADAGER